MSAGDVALFSLADQRLAWLDQRQVLISQNIANADTPGWQERDLQPFAATLAAAGGIAGGAELAPTRTNPLHLVATGDPPSASKRIKPTERAPDGNAVPLEDEMVKLADTGSSHEFVTNIYKTYLLMFKTAAT